MKNITFALIFFIASGLLSNAQAASYSVWPGSSVTVECLSTATTCNWEGNISYTPNAQGKTLYKTTLYQSSAPYLSYQVTNDSWADTNNWTTGNTSINQPMEPGQGIFVKAKAYYPIDSLKKIPAKKNQVTLYIDGQTCNENNPTDCYYYGGQAFDVIFVLKEVAQPTPTPTPVPTPTPSATPKVVATPIVSASASPTPTPKAVAQPATAAATTTTGTSSVTTSSSLPAATNAQPEANATTQSNVATSTPAIVGTASAQAIKRTAVATDSAEINATSSATSSATEQVENVQTVENSEPSNLFITLYNLPKMLVESIVSFFAQLS